MQRLFPGIDPYIEAQYYWGDFKASSIVYLQDAIFDVLPDPYDARIAQRFYQLEWPPGSLNWPSPDLAIEPSSVNARAAWGSTVLEDVREVYLEITHPPERTLVTVVELLTPDNKAGPGHSLYMTNREALLQRSVHLVELDFLVGGKRLPMARPLPPGDAYAIVARGDRRPDCDVYAWSIRQPLTTIRVPLLAPDPDILLDLAAVYATSFEKGRYARSIDYTKPLTTSLSADDRAWAEALAKTMVR